MVTMTMIKNDIDDDDLSKFDKLRLAITLLMLLIRAMRDTMVAR